MVGTFKKMLVDPNPRAVSSLCYRLKEVYFQRLGSVSQSSFVRFFQNRIYSKVYVFSKILLDFVSTYAEQEDFSPPEHDQLMELPIQKVSDLISDSSVPVKIDKVQKFLNEFPYLVVSMTPDAQGRYLVRLDDDSEVYEDLDVYYDQVVQSEIVKRHSRSPVKKKKNKKKKKIEKVTFQDFDWEDIDDDEDLVPQVLPSGSNSHFDIEMISRPELSTFIDEVKESNTPLVVADATPRPYVATVLNSICEERFAIGLQNEVPGLTLDQAANRYGYESIEHDENFEGFGTFE